jgi:hypothetical protein
LPSTWRASAPASSVATPQARSQSALPPAISLGTRCRWVSVSAVRDALTLVNA